VLDFLAHTLTNRLLHAPTVALRQAALEGDNDLARAADKLFPATGIETGASDDGNPEAEN
jgi:glutamyl-tRNA reductase